MYVRAYEYAYTRVSRRLGTTGGHKISLMPFPIQIRPVMAVIVIRTGDERVESVFAPVSRFVEPAWVREKKHARRCNRDCDVII